MDFLFLLAEDTPDVSKGIGWLERLLQGGVPLICLAIAALAVGFAIWQMRRNNAQTKEHLDEVKGNRSAALNKQEGFLREMIEMSTDHQEANLAQTQAMESFSHALRDARTAQEDMVRKVDSLSVALTSKLEALTSRIDTQADRIRTLEDEIRRSTRGSS